MCGRVRSLSWNARDVSSFDRPGHLTVLVSFRFYCFAALAPLRVRNV